MKILTPMELKRLTPMATGNLKKSEFRDMLKGMQVGQSLFVPKDEWFGYGYAKTTTPAASASSVSIESDRKLKFRTKLFEEGWVIERVY